MAAALVAGDGRYVVDDDAAVLLLRYRGPRVLDVVLPADQAPAAALAAVRSLGGSGVPDELTAPPSGGDVAVTVDGDGSWTRIEIRGGGRTWWEVL